MIKRSTQTGLGRWCYPAKLMAVALLSSVAAVPAAKAAPSPFELMKQSDTRHRIPVERTEALLILQKKGEAPQERRVTTLTVQDDRKGDRSRIEFTAPPNVAGTASLNLENPGGEDEQWLYLPAFRRTRRIGTAELGDRFVGTDFFYEDQKRRRVEDFTYTMTGAERVDGQDCWVIESRPKAPKVVKESPYGKQVVWLRKDNLFAVRVRMFDRRMRPWKEMRMTKLVKVGGRAWRADDVSVVDIQRDHRTIVKIAKRKTDLAVDPQTFTKHRLSESL